MRPLVVSHCIWTSMGSWSPSAKTARAPTDTWSTSWRVESGALNTSCSVAAGEPKSATARKYGPAKLNGIRWWSGSNRSSTDALAHSTARSSIPAIEESILKPRAPRCSTAQFPQTLSVQSAMPMGNATRGSRMLVRTSARISRSSTAITYAYRLAVGSPIWTRLYATRTMVPTRQPSGAAARPRVRQREPAAPTSTPRRMRPHNRSRPNSAPAPPAAMSAAYRGTCGTLEIEPAEWPYQRYQNAKTVVAGASTTAARRHSRRAAKRVAVPTSIDTPTPLHMTATRRAVMAPASPRRSARPTKVHARMPSARGRVWARLKGK